MSVADELNKTRQYLKDAYAKVEEKGGTLPPQQNMASLADAIDTVSGGAPAPTPTHDIPYFDGGEYGAIAYLLNEEDGVQYYTAKSADDLNVNAGSSANLGTVVATLDNGTAISRAQVLAYSVGTSDNHPGEDYFLSRFYGLEYLYGLEKFRGDTIGSHFLSYTDHFNQPVAVPEGVATIKDYFVYAARVFDQPVTLPNSLESIGVYFLGGNYAFNQPIALPSSLRSIGNDFLSGARGFNQPVTVPEGVTKIANNFLEYCEVLNQPVTLPDSVTHLGVRFLGFCYRFNQPIKLPASLTSISYDFLTSCYSFNQPIELPGTLTDLSSGFLKNCYSFNQPITIPPLVKVLSYEFLAGCLSFNQPLTFPSTVTQASNEFLYDCPLFTGPLDVGKATYASLKVEKALTVTDPNCPAYTKGLILTGQNAEAWKNKLPDRDVSPYRKLKVVKIVKDFTPNKVLQDVAKLTSAYAVSYPGLSNYLGNTTLSTETHSGAYKVQYFWLASYNYERYTQADIENKLNELILFSGADDSTSQVNRYVADWGGAYLVGFNQSGWGDMTTRGIDPETDGLNLTSDPGVLYYAARVVDNNNPSNSTWYCGKLDGRRYMWNSLDAPHVRGGFGISSWQSVGETYAMTPYSTTLPDDQYITWGKQWHDELSSRLDTWQQQINNWSGTAADKARLAGSLATTKHVAADADDSAQLIARAEELEQQLAQL